MSTELCCFGCYDLGWAVEQGSGERETQPWLARRLDLLINQPTNQDQVVPVPLDTSKQRETVRNHSHGGLDSRHSAKK